MESTLSLSLSDIQKEVAFLLGFSRTSADWSEDQGFVVESCIRSGLRNFYTPPPIAGMGTAYDWSFLRPTAQLAVPSGTFDLDLPDDFGGLEGHLYFAGNSSVLACPLPITGEGSILQRRAEFPSTTGRPIMAAIRPKRGTTAAHGQRFELIVWPTTDTAYTLQFTYRVMPDALTAHRPYPYGGAQHAETILESCLSVAEARVDDQASLHEGLFLKRLTASISADRKLKGQTIGYNADQSDLRETGYDWQQARVLGVTVSGVQY